MKADFHIQKSNFYNHCTVPKSVSQPPIMTLQVTPGCSAPAMVAIQFNISVEHGSTEAGVPATANAERKRVRPVAAKPATSTLPPKASGKKLSVTITIFIRVDVVPTARYTLNGSIRVREVHDVPTDLPRPRPTRPA